VSNQIKAKGRAPLPWLVGCHLKRAPPLQEGRTSLPTCAQILKDMPQSNANQLYLVPFDSLIDFAIKFSPNLSPFILFLFLTWLIFIELKCLFWVFEGKINFE
jgi:hypothetical protein